jgi:hypothetical protein
MLTKTIDCVDCGRTVQYGRLSCPECGALLASVAGAVRSPRAALRAMPVGMSERASIEEDAPIAESAAPADAEIAEPEPAASAAPAEAIAPAESAAPAESVKPEATTESGPPAEAAATEPEAAAPEAELVQPESAVPAESAASLDVVTEPEPRPEPGSAPALEPSLAPWIGTADPAPMLSPRPYRHFVDSGRPDPPSRPPSVYRPPNLTLESPDAIGPGGAAVPANAGQAQAPTGAPGGIATLAVSEHGMVGAERFTEIAGSFVVVGAAMSVLGFLLPWSRVVIGAASTGGYLDSWGLASPTHVLVVIGLLAVLGIGVMRTPVATWIWAGVAGLVLGSLVIGLTWPYLVGRLGADVGVLIAALGGLALVIGGVVTSWATRHAVEDSPV